MKLTITIEDSAQILAALYEKWQRIEHDTGETPRKLMLTTKKVRRQIQNNLKKRKDENKRRRKTSNQGKADGDKESAPDGRHPVKSASGRTDKGEQHTECKA